MTTVYYSVALSPDYDRLFKMEYTYIVRGEMLNSCSPVQIFLESAKATDLLVKETT